MLKKHEDGSAACNISFLESIQQVGRLHSVTQWNQVVASHDVEKQAVTRTPNAEGQRLGFNQLWTCVTECSLAARAL